jgi:1-acyl-sn-glycerol-3-phosphate acyltransferase
MLASVVATVRTFVLVPLFFVFTLGCAAVIIGYGTFRPASPIHDRILDLWSDMFLRIPPVHVTTVGHDLIDPGTRYIVVSNHLSLFDIPLLFHILPVKGRFLSKKELFRIPLVGRAMRTIGIIEVDRTAGGSSRQAINDGVTVAAERGYSLIVFPEGTRSDAATMLPFKKGAFRIAIDTGLPILPVVLEGTDRISKPGSKVYRPGHAQVTVLPPIETATLTNRDDLSTLMKTTEQAIADEYDRLRG